eukprot:11109068-Alexandrium_andersonii.AAC.1
MEMRCREAHTSGARQKQTGRQGKANRQIGDRLGQTLRNTEIGKWSGCKQRQHETDRDRLTRSQGERRTGHT